MWVGGGEADKYLCIRFLFSLDTNPEPNFSCCLASNFADAKVIDVHLRHVPVLT